MSETEARFSVLRKSADAEAVAALEKYVREAKDIELNRINVIDFAARHGLPEGRVLDTFLHAAQIGLFDMSWNVLCPGCGGVLGANATLKSVHHEEYHCALCAAGYEPTLDEMIEVSFTVTPRIHKIAAHTPHELPIWDYFRQVFWSSGI